ncbi:hypothetical protein [Paracoccus marcusii]|uniref:Uncharacterized protein n=1 Tax=Paracoccus marcusii TaxID=59779 RepID=A0ABY7UP08_9RHOB|nr:hypothetical protein [Paracoccus marcusii]WDA11673.1 hypothetical protein PRL19_10225 [Paracoccus marcusii]
MPDNLKDPIKIPSSIRQAENGRLLLIGGNHGVAKVFASDSPGVPDSRVSVFLDNHDRRMSWTRTRNITYSQWVFPDPIVFKGSMPPGSVRSIFEASVPLHIRPSNIMYPLDVIDGHSDRQSLTDSHYSLVGNMHLAAEVAQKTLSIDTSTALDVLCSSLLPLVSYTGDLGVQCNPHVSELRAKPPQLAGIRTASNGVQAGNMGIIQLTVSENSMTDRTLLIFGDSFFRSLLPELARYWRSIVFFRTQFFHDEMIEAIMPDDILCGLAERYFPTTSPDSERPHFLSYPLMMGRRTSPDAEFPKLWNELVDSKALASIMSSEK